MKKYTRLLWVGGLLLLSISLHAQNLTQRVTFSFTDEPLGKVLIFISDAYNVRFTYSSKYVPVDQKVDIYAANTALDLVLEDLFAETKVVFTSIGGQVVLGIDPDKEIHLIGSMDPGPPKKHKNILVRNPIIEDQLAAVEKNKQSKAKELTVGRRELKSLPGGERVLAYNLEKYRLPIPLFQEDEALAGTQGDMITETRLAQVSVLPFVGTNLGESDKITNNLSLNLFWGANGGVDGVEVGGFLNYIAEDVRGVQVAGLGNVVDDQVIGTQVSGLFNVTKGQVQGIQASGLFNVSGEADVVQAAGIFNIAKGDLTGVQASGLFNVSKGAANGLQISGLFNTATNDTKTQISGLFNVAEDVEYGQASGLINVAKNVKGFQFGLINICDTISGVPIGLLNFVKKGYNRVELSANDALYANFSLKLGAYSFYNIIHFGVRWDDVALGNGQETETLTSWGLGYGVGTAFILSKKTLMNLELLTQHINETEAWTNELNLLNQLKILVDLRFTRRTSLFAGPILNVMVSDRVNPDTGEVGSIINGSNTLFTETDNGNRNVRGWIGFSAGMRF